MLKKILLALLGATSMLCAIAADTATTAPMDSPAVRAAINAAISILLDDDAGTSTGSAGGSTGGTGTTGGTGSGGTALPGQITLANFSVPHLGDPDAGTLPGELGVSNAGTATYSIPIAVPPGTAGLQPGLSLNYGGSTQNGQLGVGWSLGGLSNITRCAKTIAQDGMNGRVGFTTADRLCLDGQRLLVVNRAAGDDNYWTEGAEYRTEIETFSRITALGSIGARTFKVEAKDGRLMTYGGGTASVAVVVQPIQSGVNGKQPDASTKVGAQSWAIARLQDRIGNYINFEYSQDMTRGEHRVAVIRYGGMGNSGPNPAHAAVHFSYDDTRVDKWKRYLDETRIDLVSRLNGIVTYVGDNLDGAVYNGLVPSGWNEVRRYNLAYMPSSSSGRSLLKSVEACARGVCLPKTEFDWGQPDPSKTAGFTSIGNWPGSPVLTTHNAGNKANHADYFDFADFENDGYIDVLEKRIASPAGANDSDSNPISIGVLANQYAYYHNTGQFGTGFSKYTYGLSTGEVFAVLEVGDFNGDGALDILVRTDSQTKICLSPLANPAALGAPGSKFTFDCNSGLAAKGDNSLAGRPRLVDVTGDGRPSHYARESTKDYLCSGSSCVEDTQASNYYIGLGSPFLDQIYDHGDLVPYSSSLAQTYDFAGVGRSYNVRGTSAYYAVYNGPDFGYAFWTTRSPRIAITGFRKPGESVPLVADYSYPAVSCSSAPCSDIDKSFNGAGLAADFSGSGYHGLIFGYLEFDQASGSLYKKAETTLCQSTGRALDCEVRNKYSGVRSDSAGDTGYSVIHSVANFIGDGMPGVLVEKLSYAAAKPIRTGQLQMCRIIGNATSADKADTAMTCTDWTGPGLPEQNASTSAGDQFYFMDLLGTGRTQLVKYHAGQYVGSTWVEDGRWEVFAPVDTAVAGQALDRIYRATNGLGAVSTVEYAEQGAVSRSNKVYSFPVQRTAAKGKIVKRIVKSNGGAVSRTTSYAYQDAAVNMLGRGMAGFGKIISTDFYNGITSTREFGQVWPQIGQMFSERVEGNGCLLTNRTNTFQTQAIPQANGVKITFPYLLQTVAQRRDWNCADLGTMTTTNTFEGVATDIYGNLKRQETISEGGGSKIVSVAEVSYQDNAANWLIGLPVAVTRTRTNVDAGASSSGVRKVAYAYDANGLLSKVTTEPDAVGDEADLYRVVTDYTRAGNTFGLVKQVKQTWKDRYSGQVLTRTLSDTDYDSKGRFPASVKNALGQAETYGFDSGTGAKVSLIGPNGLAVTWDADGFGRPRTAWTNVDGIQHQVRRYFKKCSGDCPGGAKIVQITDSFSGPSRSDIPVLVYADSQGRVLTTETWGFDATRIRADREYDGQGRLHEVFKPGFLSQTRYSDARFIYDGAGRVTSVYRRDETGAENETKTDYNGYRTVQTNAGGYTRTIDRDAAGQMRAVVDANGKSTSYSYDAFGNLSTATDPRGNVTSVSYDKLGRKTDLRDPDLGWIHYDVDPLGRVWNEVSPNQRALGRSTRSEYDSLDRMTGRYEYDLESHWVYDTAANGIGLLAEAYTGTALKKDYSRVYDYFSLGRPKQVTQTLTDGVYKQTTEYDTWNRPSAQVYQRNSDTAKRYDIRYNDMGYLARVERGSLVLWRASKKDAANRVTEAVLGNGLVETQVFNSYTDSLTSVQSNLGGTRRLEVAYEYDKLNNVSKRTQFWETTGFSEDFGYDSLNRVKRSQVQGQTEQLYTYNDDGGIATKTGLGSYTYPTPGAGVVRPHAVKNIGGIGDFNYDDNGNLLNGAGRTITWTGFDMPKRISNATASSEFVYGPEHQRVRQDRGDGSKIIYAGPQEVVTSSSGTTVKTYWPGGIGLEIDRPGVATELRWSHVDHLGSTIALTDETGNVKERMSYDVWGKWRRLNADGSVMAMTGLPDNSGYTGHEMLEQLDLVHMNGRVYDPSVGRFLSGDALVQDPQNSQSFNRYSYVMNNPINRVDPTGFAASPPREESNDDVGGEGGDGGGDKDGSKDNDNGGKSADDDDVRAYETGSLEEKNFQVTVVGHVSPGGSFVSPIGLSVVGTVPNDGVSSRSSDGGVRPSRGASATNNVSNPDIGGPPGRGHPTSEAKTETITNLEKGITADSGVDQYKVTKTTSDTLNGVRDRTDTISSLNISSTSRLIPGIHNAGSDHEIGQAVDINKINGVHVSATGPGRELADALKASFMANNNVRYVEGPGGNYARNSPTSPWVKTPDLGTMNSHVHFSVFGQE